jgi:hypothetical protein
VTTAHARPAESVPARSWRAFRRWRQGRPFWGGLLLILSAIELFFSSNLNPSALEVHFGPTGFLSYVIPGMLLLCGLLSWLSPGQRLFYGIVGTLTAVYSLIGLNLGGFFVGLLLGCVGGALTVAWAPAASPSVPETDAEEVLAEPYDETYAGQRSTAIYGEPRAGEELRTDEDWEAEQPSDLRQEWPAADAAPEFQHGLLTDTLPTSLRSPLQDPVPHRSPGGLPGSGDQSGGRHSATDSGLPARGGSGSADDEPPPGDGTLPRRRMRFFGGMFAILLLMTAAVGVVNRPTAALAEACAPTTKSAPSLGGTGNAGAGKTTAPPAQQPAPAQQAVPGDPPASPSPSAASKPGGGVVGGIINGIVGIVTGIFGGGKKADPVPSASSSSAPPTTPPATPTNAPTTAPTGSQPAPGKTSAKPCTPSGSAAPAPSKIAKLDAGQPAVAREPALLLTARMDMVGLVYQGLADLTVRTGPGSHDTSTITALKFTMSTSVSTPFELRVPGGPKLLVTKSSSLTIDGNVTIYVTRFAAKVYGLIPLTFTPSFQPPPIIPLPGMYTDCSIDLVFVQADTLMGRATDIEIVS